MARVIGTVEHVIHRNAENGYSVVEISDEQGLLTLVGILPELSPGEPIEAEGSFVTHPVYGQQLQVEHFTLLMPEDAVAIERYLASGIIKGVGPALAGRIVKKFKGDALRVMEEQPELLAKVRGISPKGARLMQEQVIAKREMREAMMYLEQFGISIPLAVRIYERYGNTLYSVIQSNPYKLMDDITHVGFRIADDIARRAGLPADSEYRIRSGVNYAMQQALQAGKRISMEVRGYINHCTTPFSVSVAGSRNTQSPRRPAGHIRRWSCPDTRSRSPRWESGWHRHRNAGL